MNHESLFKSTNPMSRALSKSRGKNINQERTIKRSDIHFSRRNIKEDVLSPKCDLGTNIEKDVPIQEKKEKLLAKLSKQEEYVKKFMAWKAQKDRFRKEDKKKVDVKKPFYTAVSSHGLKNTKPPTNIMPSTKIKTVTAEKKNVCPKPIQRRAPVAPPLNIAVVSPLKQSANTKENKVNINNNKINICKNKQIKEHQIHTVKNKAKQMLGKMNLNVLKEKHHNNNNVQGANIQRIKSGGKVNNNQFNVGKIALEFLASTAKKSSENNPFFSEIKDTISPIEILSSPNNEGVGSTGKLKRSHSKITEIDNNNRSKEPKKQSIVNKKFDFRKSPKILEIENKIDSLTKQIAKATPNTVEEKLEDRQQSSVSTPPKKILNTENGDLKEMQTPCNYVSPFVRLSRGKGSAKKEQEKRESLYKLERSFKSPEESVQDRRTRESVKYFRKLLQNETERLENLCSSWEGYKDENNACLEENGADMINASVGQTKLLLRKKFQQFDDLINRCENCIGLKETENCGGVQKVYSDDLEGFWAIVKHQVDNIDARFDNLDKWKENNWNDPQEIKAKESTVTHLPQTLKPKSRKIKSRAHNALLEVLRKTQAAYKKNKQVNPNLDNDVIFVPAKDLKTHRISPKTNPKPRCSINIATHFEETDINTKDFEPEAMKNLSSFSNQPVENSVKPMKKRCSTPLMQFEEANINAESTKSATDDFPSCSKTREKKKRRSKVSTDLISFTTPVNHVNTPRKSLRLSAMTNCNEEIETTPFRLMSPWIRKNCVSCSPKMSSSIIKSAKHKLKDISPPARKSILKTPGSTKPRHRSVIFNDYVEVKSPLSTPDSQSSFNGRHSLRLRNRRIVKREITEIP